MEAGVEDMEDVPSTSAQGVTGANAAAAAAPPPLRTVRVKLRSDFGERTNVFRGVCERELGMSRNVRKRPFLDEFTATGKGSGILANYASNEEFCPPFAIQFGKTKRSSHLLAVADEDGYVTISDTREELPQSKDDDHKPKVRWAAHNNSIFDLAWSHDDRFITTVSGDETVVIWSAEKQLDIASLSGHTGSIKSVSHKPENENILASAGRDGRILLWDMRLHRSPSGEVYNPLDRTDHGVSGVSPVKEILNAHIGNRKPRDLRGRRKKYLLNRASRHSVTTVLFLKVDNILASSGADGLVKFWDIRKLGRPSHLITLPEPPGLSRNYGIPSIAQDDSGSKLAVTSYNDTIYLYDCMRPECEPVQMFKGHDVSSFYIKLTFSPDGSHILSGSSDSNAYIWQVDRPEDGAYVIKGHEGEVSGVSWCQTDFNKIATCSDDSTFRVWNIQRREQPESRKIAMPPTVRLHHSLSFEERHNYMDEMVETSFKHQKIGPFTQETYIDCSKIGEGTGKSKGKKPQQYRNTTLDEIWGVNYKNS